MALVALAAAAVAVQVSRLDRERIRAEIEQRITTALGLEVRAAKVGFSVGWELRVAATDVRVANVPGRPSPHLLEADRVGLSLRWGPLFRGQVEVDGIVLRGATLRLEEGTDAGEGAAPASLQPDWSALEDGPRSAGVHLAMREIEAEDLVVWLTQADGERRIHIDELSLEASGPGRPGNAQLRGEFDGEPFRLSGRLGPAAAWTDPALPYQAQLRGSALGAEWDVDATLREPLALRGLEITSLRVHTRGADAVVSGSVAQVRPFSGVALTVQAKVGDDAVLDRWLGRELPPLDMLEVDGAVRDADGSLGFEGRMTATARNGAAVLDLDGVHGNVDDIADLDAHFTLRARDLASLLANAGSDFDAPPLAPLTAQGRLRGSDGHLGVHDVTLEAGTPQGLWLRATGALANLKQRSGVNVEAQFGAADAAALSDWFGRPLPLTGPLKGSLALSDADGTLGVDRLRASDTQGEGVVDFEVEVVAGDLRGGGDVVVDATVSAEGLHHMGQLVGVGLPPVGPAMWKGRVRGAERSVAVDGTLKVGSSEIHTRSRWRKDRTGRGDLRLALRTPELRIADLGISPDGWAGQSEDRFAWARSRRRLDLEGLRRLDATVTLDAKRVLGRHGYDASDLHADLDLRHGVLNVGYQETVDDSPTTITLSADVREEPPSYGLRVHSQRFDLTVPSAQVHESPRFSGLVDFEADLQGRGRSPDAVRRSLSGSLLVTGRDGAFDSQYARAFFQDIFLRILKRTGDKPPTQYRCLMGDFTIERGVLHPRALFVDLSGVHLAGRGSIDLAAGRWDLVIRPHVYGPGLIGGGATVEVSGPLDHPTFRARALSVPVSMGETLASRILTPLELAARPLTGGRDRCADLP